MKSNLDKLLQIRNLSNGHAALYFYGEIVDDWYGAWNVEDQYPERIRQFLKEAAGKDLDVFINSPGGSVFAAMAIVNMLRRHEGTTTCYIDGLAASSASVIALCCNKVVMPKNTFLMIHKAWSIAIGNSEDFIRYAELLEKCDEGILTVYEGKMRSGISVDQIRTIAEEETWLTAKEASQYFDIEVTEASVKPAAFAVGKGKISSAPQAVKDAVELALETERIRLLNMRKEGDVN